MKHTKSRVWYIPAAVLVLLFAAAIWFFCSYSLFSGRVISRRAETVDLRGTDVST